MMKQVQDQKCKIIRDFELYTMEFSLIGEAMLIEVTSKSEEDIYWTRISQDTIPQTMKTLFPDPTSIYEFFEEPTDSGQIIIPSIDRIVLSIKVGKNMRELPIFLSKKIMSVEEKLTRKINQLQSELRVWKAKSEQNFEIISLQLKIEQKQQLLEDFNIRVESLLKQNLRLQNIYLAEHDGRQAIEKNNQAVQMMKKLNQQLTMKISLLEEERIKLIDQNSKITTEVKNLNEMIQSQNAVIAEYEKQILKNRDLIKDFTGENAVGKKQQQNIKEQVEGIAKFGQPLIFKPLPNSINAKLYDFSHNLLTKNGVSNNGAGRMIPCADPIPKIGRFYYKLINRSSGKNHPNFRIGVVARSNLIGEGYMNGGDSEAVMYYCYCPDKEMTYEGTAKMQGFNIYKDNTLTIVIDREKKQVEWFVNNEFKTLSKFTEPMKKSQNLFLFVQMWNNGDSFEFIDR